MGRTAWVYRWLGLAVLAAAGAGCQPSKPSNTDVLKIGAYSVVREVLQDGVLPAFQAEWKSRTGRELRFEQSYNGSGAQARAIAGGFDADLAVLSHEGDMEVLVKAGRVKAGWNAGPSKGMRSPIAWS
jgi:sulfate/thiosulfate transport system substrate-binding protein